METYALTVNVVFSFNVAVTSDTLFAVPPFHCQFIWAVLGVTSFIFIFPLLFAHTVSYSKLNVGYFTAFTS